MSLKIVNEISEPNGQWIECGLGCGGIFFRHDVGHKCFGLGDKLGICPICIFNKKMQTQTFTPGEKANVSDYVHHKAVESKPESDTL